MSSHSGHSHSRPNLKKKKKKDKVEKANEIRGTLAPSERVRVIRFTSMKSECISNVRREFRSSTLCMAKHNVIAHAFGTTPEDSVRPNLYKLSQYLAANTGVFMTNEPHERISQFLESLTGPEFAQTGDIATETFTVPVGPLFQFRFNMDSYLRGLGLPVQLEKGVVTNVRDYDVCVAGEPLTKKAVELLKQFGVKMGRFEVKLIAVWQAGEILTPNA
jgi:mRNA turnover protein 4